MARLKRGSFSLNLGIVTLSGDLNDDDRQCAWELYTELSTRVAVTGKPSDCECTNFDGELFIESLESLFGFIQEARQIMRKFPVGRVEVATKNHLGILICCAINGVLRPFLEKWQVRFRHWWENQSNPRLGPLDRQAQYPQLEEFLHDWAAVRWLMRNLQEELAKVYSLIEVSHRNA